MSLIRTPEIIKDADLHPLATTINVRFLTKEIADFLAYMGYSDTEVKVVYMKTGWLLVYVNYSKFNRGIRVDFY